MNDISNDPATGSSENERPSNPAQHKTAGEQDIHDSPSDEESLKVESFTLDLPDVADIPGQEHVHVPQMKEFADVTASSDDEEGVGLFGDDDVDDELEMNMGTEADVNPEERKALRTAAEDIAASDDSLLREAALDNRDEEGEPLNEGSSASKVSGEDLDVPGAEEDDTDEAMGEEDEENNAYSEGSDNNDDIPSDSF